MSGNTIGGQKARDKFLARDPDYYSKLGAKGGKVGVKEYLSENREHAATIGRKGGQLSKKGYKYLGETRYSYLYRNNVTGAELKISKLKETK